MAWPSTGSFTAWSGRVTLTSDAALIDEAIPYVTFPLSIMPPEFWAAVDANGDDIRITEDDGETELPSYVISIDTVLETGRVAFLATGLSASVNVDYYLYVGNSSASPHAVTDPNGRNAVFASEASFHLPGMFLTDLTGNGHNLTAVNSPGTAAGNLEGITAATYNGSNQYHHSTAPVTVTPYSMFVAGTTSSIGVSGHIISLSFTTNDSGPLAVMQFAGATVGDPVRGFTRGANGLNGNFVAASGSYTANTLTTMHLRNTGISGNTHIFRDGGNNNSISNSHNEPSFTIYSLGASARQNVSAYVPGTVEVALTASVDRSNNYITTTHNVWTNSAFLTLGAWEAAMYDAKFNFRATSGYVTDGAGETYVLGETSSQSRDGHTFQWDVCGDCSRDRSTGVGSRFAGINKRDNNGTQNTWTLTTLPETGWYEIRAALGDANNSASATYAYFYDDATLIDDIVGVTASPTTNNHYVDATGVTLANAAWEAGNTPLVHNFASTTFRIRIGAPTNVGGESRLAHLRITKVDAPVAGGIEILRRRRE